MNIPEKVVALGRMGIYPVLTGTEHCGSGGSALDNFFGWARTESTALALLTVEATKGDFNVVPDSVRKDDFEMSAHVIKKLGRGFQHTRETCWLCDYVLKPETLE